MTLRRLLLAILVLGLILTLPTFSGRVFARIQEQASEPAQGAPADQSIGGALAKESREAAGEEEENENLKHSSVVKKLAKVTGLSIHQAHLVAIGLNFAIIAFVIFWFTRKSVPAAMRNRTASIQRALQEARAASEDANRRLGEIENRLKQLATEIGKMQVNADKEAEAEEGRIRTATEEDIHKVVQAAEQEIAAAAKQARRELMAHTADLAVALARAQIQVDSATDQSLVRNFAGKLSSGNGGKDGA
jgi:F-type H+-transporting ATPase subunit b